MPKEIDGLPLHPLVVHAVVVLVPLTALVAVLFLVPRFRAALRWPMILLAMGALGATYVAVQSGENLEETVVPPGAEDSELARAIERHEELAEQLWYVVIAFAIVVLIAAYVLRPIGEIGPFPGEDAEGDEEPSTTLDAIVRGVVALLVVVGAVAAGGQTYRAGEQGSQALWNTPDENFDYSAGALE